MDTATALTHRPHRPTLEGGSGVSGMPHAACASSLDSTAASTSSSVANLGPVISSPNPWTFFHSITDRFLVVDHSATVPSSAPVIHVSAEVNATLSSCPPPGLGRKMSCESSATFQNLHVLSLPTVTTRSFRCGATPKTSLWCPNRVSTYAMSSRDHTFRVLSVDEENIWPVPSRMARPVTAPRCDANSCTFFMVRVSQTWMRLSVPATHSMLCSWETAQQSSVAAPHLGGAIGPPPPRVGSTTAGGPRGNRVLAPVSMSHRAMLPSLDTV